MNSCSCSLWLWFDLISSRLSLLFLCLSTFLSDGATKKFFLHLVEFSKDFFSQHFRMKTILVVMVALLWCSNTHIYLSYLGLYRISCLLAALRFEPMLRGTWILKRHPFIAQSKPNGLHHQCLVSPTCIALWSTHDVIMILGQYKKRIIFFLYFPHFCL